MRVVFFLIGCFVMSCVAQQESKKIYESEIVAVYSQTFAGGVKGTPQGIKYKILMVAPRNNEHFNIIGCWINDEYAIAKPFKDKPGINKILFNKGDTVTLSVNLTLTPEGYKATAIEKPISKPTGFNDKILVGYEVNNRVNYIGFNKITELSPELRP